MFSIDQLQLLPPSKWEDLENLVKDLFRAEWRDFHTQRHARQGQSQQGVDVFGRPSSVPGWAGVQCKNKDLLIRSQLTVKELRQEVRKAKAFQPPLVQFIIATTAPRDGRLQNEARKITERHLRRGEFSVHVYGWDDIKELLAKHEQVAMQYYGNVAGVGTNSKPPLLSEAAMAAAFGIGRPATTWTLRQQLLWSFPPKRRVPLASWRQAHCRSPWRATAASFLTSTGRPRSRR